MREDVQERANRIINSWLMRPVVFVCYYVVRPVCDWIKPAKNRVRMR